MTDTILAGIIGATVAGIVPFIIYLLTETKKKQERRLVALYDIHKELESFIFKSDDLKFELERASTSENLIEKIKEINEFFIIHFFDKKRKMTHSALFIDSEVYNRTLDFFEETFKELKQMQMEFAYKKTFSEQPSEKIEQYNKLYLFGLSAIGDNGEKLNDLIKNKTNYYYQKHYPAWKFWLK
ncbi:hypothetical protein [Bacillus swezeyi]|uniref:hypothetical protein n=1 Tax=Bacillus swezeyi TaxID=1925020 RepID=UPI00123BBC24|nr:hypothetical protein [Bacillus swezeyi]KAA6472213.1 hypothetical protein DX928_22580 [Bacillus swezeyi]